MPKPKNIDKIIKLLKKQSKQFENPIAMKIGERLINYYDILIIDKNGKDSS